ncbi:hypothetical protein P691DRAFT_807353 [Macrolepiota fuliginosa MF-IS2]|uniref:G domain-containing protein n=1 Tax=Macrolepiota fuliginosa MF-IS2 TaxID=1400762 RepID=A0A9P6BXV7_9AGAR|nr:hypothetical protein P691DRAFT_807353 [Macrolepiota fuliginosa MF-IS2]
MTMLTEIPNIIIFGESGSGKSSVVNMLVGRPVAKTSSGVRGCTFDSCAYDVDVLGQPMKLWDTAGLDEGETGRIPHSKSVVNLYKLVLDLGSNGVSLLMFVTRPRFKDSTLKNWKLFHEIICQKKVPSVIIITGLELEEDRDEWWWKNRSELAEDYGITPDDHACITAVRGKSLRNGTHMFDEEFETSKERVQWVMRSRFSDPWRVSPPQWCQTIFKSTSETRWCGLRPPKTVVTEEEVIGEAFQQLIETGMSEEDVEELVEKFREAEQTRTD